MLCGALTLGNTSSGVARGLRTPKMVVDITPDQRKLRDHVLAGQSITERQPHGRKHTVRKII
ncbi:hypothetical protein SEA_WEISS13_89 [Mycobacterium phage Weiss13]|uniref:Uncharacterized protein n=1 Tax=Mycobacterium phage Weiss13 TaxID=1784843 RepID=A0A0Y0AF88_9CAUD|nr:hypothetical protein SEA_WEISS13_89 [Mycobacterium phage Weiss13]